MYWIVTDSTIDMPKEWIDSQNHVLVKYLSYILDGKSYIPTGTDEESRQIYKQLREGKKITTTQVNSAEWYEAFRSILVGGEDILAIIFSSGLSGTYQAAVNAAEELRNEFPDRTITVIDSLAASAGEGLLVQYAIWNRDKGMSLTENALWVQDHVLCLHHWFTVDDLMFLLRGGRVSAVSAYIGTVVRIKPVLNVDSEGRLIPREKMQGRKKSIRLLFSKVKEHIVNPDEQEIFISHGDCLEEAQSLADMIKSELNVRNVRLSYIGPIIGSHAGPGTIAVFFLGKAR